MQKVKTGKFWIIKVILSIIILAALATSVDFEFTSVDYRLIVFIVPALILSLLIRALRWLYIINLNKRLIDFVTSCKLLLVGQALNTFLPAGSGDIVKSYYGYKWTGLKEEMLSASLVDKIVAISSVFILALFSFFLQKSPIYLYAAAIALVPLIFILIPRAGFIRKIAQWLDRIRVIDINKLLDLVSIPRRALLVSIALSTLGWISTYTILYLCFKSLNIDISFTTVILTMPVLPIVRLFPLTLNGMGTDEFAIIQLFTTSGSAESALFLAAIYFKIVTLFVPAIFGLIIILMSKPKKTGFRYSSHQSQKED